MAKQLNSYEVKLDFKADTSQAKKELQQFQQSLDQLINSGTRQYSFGKDISKELGTATRTVMQLKENLQNAFNVDTGKLDLGKFQESMKRSGNDLQTYKAALTQLGPEGSKAFNQLVSSITQAEVPLRRSNALLTEFWTTLKNTARWQISSSLLHGFMGSIQGAYRYAQDLNESLNNIRIVTGYSTDQMAKFAANANKAAQALSTTTTAYTDAALIYYQQGLGDEEVLGRSDVTVKMANVSRQSAEEVSDQLTAIWNNFYDGSKSLEYYADVITALGAATASSSEEISTGLEKFAAVANTVGLSYEYATAALATITATTRQSADTVGTGLRTLFARLEGLKLGDTLEDGVDLNKYSQALDTVGVKLFDVNGEIKNMDTILDETAAKWDTLSKAQQIAFAQTVGGVRQYTNLIALMDNWDFMQSNLGVAGDATGTLEEQAQIYAESWEAAQKRVKAAAEDIYGALLDDKFFINLNDILANVLKGIKNFTTALGGLKGTLSALGAVALTVFKNQIGTSIDNLLYSMGMAFGGKAKGNEFKEKALLIAKDEEGSMRMGETEAETYATNMDAQYRSEKAYLQVREQLSVSQREYYETQLKINRARDEEAQKIAKEVDELEKLTDKNAIKLLDDVINKVITPAEGIGILEGRDSIWEAWAGRKLDGRAKENKGYDNFRGTVFTELFGSEEGYERLKQGLPDELMADLEMIREWTKGSKNVTNGQASESINKIYGQIGISKYKFQEAAEELAKQDLAGQEGSADYNKLLQERIEYYEEAGVAAARLRARQQDLDKANKESDQAHSALDKAWKTIQEQGRTAGQSITNVTKNLMAYSTAINNISGLKDLWSSDDISTGQKLIKTVSTLSMSIMLLTQAKIKDTIADLANIGNKIKDIALSGISTLKTALNTVAVEGNTAAKLKALIVTKLLNAEILKGLATLGATLVILGLLTAAIYSIAKAHDNEVHKVENAKNAANELQKSYEKLREEANQFKESISEYQEGLKSLDKLKDKQDEFSEALDKSNQKAKELIETYGLWDSYSYNGDGAIVIDEEKLNEIVNQKNRQVSNAEYNALKSKAYANTLENTEAVDKNAKKLAEAYQKQYEKTTQSASSTEQFTNTVQRLNEEYTNFLNEGESLDSDLGAFQQYLLTHTGLLDNINGVLNDDIFTALQDYHESLVQVTESNKYFAEQILHNAIIEKYGEDIEKLATVNGVVDQGLYDSYVNLIASGNKESFQMALEGAEDLTNRVTSSGQLQTIISQNQDAAKTVFGRIGIDDISNITQYNAPQIYGALREAGNYNDYRTKSYAGFQSRKVYDKTGTEVLYDIPWNEMYEEIAKQIIMEATLSNTEELNNSTLKAYEDTFSQVTQNLQKQGLDLDIGVILRAAFTNGGLENWSNELDISPILNTLSESAVKGLKNLTDSQLGELFGVAEEKAEEAGSRLREQLGNWSKDAYWSHFNEEGEATAKQLGLDVDVFKAYRETLKETKKEVEDNAEVLNKLAISEKRVERGCKSLIDGWEDYNEVISRIQNTDESLWDQAQDFSEIVPDIQQALADIGDVDVSQIEKLGNKFIVENWDLITQSINGADGALDELQAKLSGLSLQNHLIEIGLDDTQAVNEIMSLHDYITSVNNLEIDVPINSGPFLAACNDMILAAQMTQQQASDYFSELGFDTEFTTKPQSVTEWVPNYQSMYSVRQTDNGFVVEKNNSDVTWERVDGTVEVPALKSITPNKAYGGNIKKLGGGGGKGKKSGGGGGKTAAAENQKITSKDDAGIKRYKEIDDALQDIAEDQERINKLTDTYYGANKVKAMKQRAEMLKQEAELHKKKYEWAKKYQDEDLANLQSFAAGHGMSLDFQQEYDAVTGGTRSGSLTNYTAIMENLYSQLNEKETYWAKASNFGSKEAQDEYKKKYIDPIAETIKEFDKLVGIYDDSRKTLDEEANDYLDRLIEAQEATYAAYKEDWDLKLEILEDQRKFLDHSKKLLGDSAIELGEAMALIGTKEGEGYLANTLGNITELARQEKELESIREQIGEDNYYNRLKEIRDGYLENTEALKELDDEMMEYYGKVMDKVNQEVEKYIKNMETLKKTLQSYQKVLKVTGRETDYDTMDDLLRGEASVIQAQYDTKAEQYELYQREVAKAEAALKAAEKSHDEKEIEIQKKRLETAKINLQEVGNEMLDILAEKAENAKAIMDNMRAKIMASYEDAMTNGLGFDYLDATMERYSTIQDLYLTKTNQVFETTKMLRKIQTDMDSTSNRAAKQRLDNFAKEIESLKARDKMTKADLELAQKRYDLLLAQIALEEAQKAKTTVRLQRDNEGNYGYVYTADEGDIAKAQDDMLNAENDLYNTRLRIANESGEAIYQINEEWMNAINELVEEYENDRNMSEEEFNKKKEEINKYYLGLMAAHSHNFTEAQKEDARVVADAWINNHDHDLPTVMEVTEKFGEVSTQTLDRVDVALDEFKQVIDDVVDEQEDRFGDSVDITHDVETAAKDLAKEIRDDLRHEYKQLFDRVGNMIDQYSKERSYILDSVIPAYTAQAKAIQEVINKRRELATVQDQPQQKYDGTGGGNGSATVGAGTGNGGSGGGGGGNPPAGGSPTYSGTNKQGGKGLDFAEEQAQAADNSWLDNSINKTKVGSYVKKKYPLLTDEEKNTKTNLIYNSLKPKTKGSLVAYAGATAGSYWWNIIQNLNTGGYTGEWHDGSGKLAVLHSKELVLNAKDTENMLAVVDMVRQITNSIDMNAASLAGGYGALSSGGSGAVGPQTLEQNVQINASFPNATNHSEIEEAFNNLINKASQYASRTR